MFADLTFLLLIRPILQESLFIQGRFQNVSIQHRIWLKKIQYQKFYFKFVKSTIHIFNFVKNINPWKYMKVPIFSKSCKIGASNCTKKNSLKLKHLCITSKENEKLKLSILVVLIRKC